MSEWQEKSAGSWAATKIFLSTFENFGHNSWRFFSFKDTTQRNTGVTISGTLANLTWPLPYQYTLEKNGYGNFTGQYLWVFNLVCLRQLNMQPRIWVKVIIYPLKVSVLKGRSVIRITWVFCIYACCRW